MRKIQVLQNQNKVQSETISNIKYANECQEFSVRMVFNGDERYTIGNRSVTVYPGNFLIINEGTTFGSEIVSDVPVNTMSVLYTGSFLNSFHRTVTSTDNELMDEPFHVPSGPVPVFPETLYPFKGDMLFNSVHLKDLFNSDVNDDVLMNEYLYHCLLNFYRVYQKEIVQKSEQLNVLKSNTRTELFRRLNNAKDYMISNYNKDISLNEICRYACLSETHFFRSFRQTFHCTPHQYLMQLRLAQSRHMLKNTNYEVKEIVSIIGFDCVSSFIRLFKNRFGVTPGNYRMGFAA